MKENTPPKGNIVDDPPMANTLEEVQETWSKAKNYPTPIAPKKDSLDDNPHIN